MTESEIDALLASFENGTVPRAEWTHARHLVMALTYLVRHGRERATHIIRDGIQRYNRLQGSTTGYHETITLAWIAVIDAFLHARRVDEGLPTLVDDLLAKCGDSNYLLRFYSRSRLFSDEARDAWVEPDLAPVETSRLD